MKGSVDCLTLSKNTRDVVVNVDDLQLHISEPFLTFLDSENLPEHDLPRQKSKNATEPQVG